jgi:hypothetical protein
MTDDLTAEEVRRVLGLEPNATCGFVKLSFESPLPIAPGGLPAPFADGRLLGSALYFMVTPEAPVQLHRIRNDQLYHYYLGDPLEVFLLHASGNSERVIVGPDVRKGSASSSPFRAAPSTRRGSPGVADGSSAAAPNGPAWCPPMSTSAISLRSLRSFRPWPLSFVPSPHRSGT